MDDPHFLNRLFDRLLNHLLVPPAKRVLQQRAPGWQFFSIWYPLVLVNLSKIN